MVQLLVTKCADLELRDQMGCTALHAAAQKVRRLQELYVYIISLLFLLFLSYIFIRFTIMLCKNKFFVFKFIKVYIGVSFYVGSGRDNAVSATVLQ